MASSSSQASSSRKPVRPKEFMIGCEFEFVVLGYRLPESCDLEEVLYQRLERPVSVTCAKCKQKHNFVLPTYEDTTKGEYGHWQLIDDETVDDFGPGERDVFGEFLHDFTFMGFELKSRVLHTNKTLPFVSPNTEKNPSIGPKKKCNHEISYAEEIRAALYNLQTDITDFDLAKQDAIADARADEEAVSTSATSVSSPAEESFVYIVTNPSCGFHVHIGNGPEGNDGYSLEFIKKLIMTNIECERQMDSLHSADRITGSSLPVSAVQATDQRAGRPRVMGSITDRDVYNAPLSVQFIHRAYLSRLSAQRDSKDISTGDVYRYDVDTWKNLVDEAESLDGVQALIGDMKQVTINLANVARSEENPTGLMNTIEFRQHTGTLSPVAAISYAEFCATFVERIFNMTEDNFNKLFGGSSGMCRRKAFGGLELVHQMKCSDMTKGHYKRLFTAADPIDALGLKQVVSDVNRITEKPAKDAVSALAEMIRVNTETRANNHCQKLIKEKIEEKLKTGGYGQFNEHDLLELLPGNTNEQTRHSLLIPGAGSGLRPWSPNSSKKRQRTQPRPPSNMLETSQAGPSSPVNEQTLIGRSRETSLAPTESSSSGGQVHKKPKGS